MQLFQLVLALMIAAALLTTLARAVGAPYPVVLALGGAALALVPGARPPIELAPDLALALFVAPVLLDAAFDTSLRDLRANWAPVVSLVLFAVLVTVAAVAVVAKWLVPDLSWAAAIALGAIVAPPDASAATTVLRVVSPPHRMSVILEAESLLNDASALLIYRFAVSAALGASVSPGAAAGALALSCLGGPLLGIGLAWTFHHLTRRVRDIPVHVVLQFAGTFAVWLLADALSVSPVLTVVAYAVTLARTSAATQGAEHRRSSFAVWDVATYVLTALAYVLVGLQIHPVLQSIDGGQALHVLGFSLAVLAAVILARVAWVMVYNRGLVLSGYLATLRGAEPGFRPTLGGAVAVSWCGMRGIITLATALALPDGDGGGPAFPHRDLLVTAAFAVVLGTLVIQGLTLGPLLRRLHLLDDDEMGREGRLARQEVARAALAFLDGRQDREADLLRREYAVRMREETSDATLDAATIGRLRLEAIAAERRALARLRRNGTIGDDTYHALEEELDWAEGHALTRTRALADLAPLDQAPDRDGER